MANDKDKSTEYYSFMLINKTKRAGFLMMFFFLYVVTTAIIMANGIQDGPWTQVLFPVILLGIPVVLYPGVEKWVYKPWQAKAQKYERHYKG